MRLGPFGDLATRPFPPALGHSFAAPACRLLFQNGSSVKRAHDFSGAPGIGAVGPGNERFSSFIWPKLSVPWSTSTFQLFSGVFLFSSHQSALDS